MIAEKSKAAGINVPDSAPAFLGQALFTTITNANFNDENLIDWIMRAQAVKKELAEAAGEKDTEGLHHSLKQEKSLADLHAIRCSPLPTLNLKPMWRPSWPENKIPICCRVSFFPAAPG